MISAVVLTKNEENTLADCLESLKWCDEIIVIDDNSEDRTQELAKRMGAVVIERKLDNNFSEQRNIALGKAQGEWVLFVDADERVPDALRGEIQAIINNPSNIYAGFLIQRIDVLFGKKLLYGETGDIKLLRLAKKQTGTWQGDVHEKWNIKGKIGKLKNHLIHYPHQTIAEFLKEINFYTTLRAKELYDQGIKTNGFSIVLYPKAKFFQGFFFRQGFRDGMPGLVFALFMSFHSFLTRGKLWLLWNKK